VCSGAQRNGMNTRNKRRLKLSITPRAEVRTFALIVCLIVIPVLGIVWGIAATTKPDLSDLAPIQQSASPSILLGWSTLLRDQAHSGQTASAAHTGAHVRVLGYMVETTGAVSEGQSVRDFVLLPEAGHLLHPAHRFGDQMIAVRLRDSTEVQFSQMALVWAWGSLRVQPGDPGGPTPLYAIVQASVQRANESDIARYFK
jgi:hypothetical protein